MHHFVQGARVPALGFGTWQLRGEGCVDTVEHALALGHRHIDTAQGYDNEAEVGRALRASGVPRDEVFLVSKVRPGNFPPSLACRADDAQRIFANQVEYHPFLHQRPLLRLAEERDGLLTAYSPIAKGAVTRDPVLRKIGETHGMSPVQVTLRWLIQQPRVATIPKAASAEHRAANVNVFGFSSSDDEMARIHALEREERLVDPVGGPAWERS